MAQVKCFWGLTRNDTTDVRVIYLPGSVGVVGSGKSGAQVEPAWAFGCGGSGKDVVKGEVVSEYEGGQAQCFLWKTLQGGALRGAGQFGSGRGEGGLLGWGVFDSSPMPHLPGTYDFGQRLPWTCSALARFLLVTACS